MTSADINLGKDIRNIINNGCRDENQDLNIKMELLLILIL